MTEPLEAFDTALKGLSAVMAIIARDGGALPEPIVTAVIDAQASGGVTPLCTGLEALWAVRADLSPASRDQLAQLAQVVARDRFGIVGATGRASAMHLALRRDRGEAGAFPDPEDDPAPADEIEALLAAPEPQEPEA